MKRGKTEKAMIHFGDAIAHIKKGDLIKFISPSTHKPIKLHVSSIGNGIRVCMNGNDYEVQIKDIIEVSAR
jgi:hypothetical protein